MKKIFTDGIIPNENKSINNTYNIIFQNKEVVNMLSNLLKNVLDKRLLSLEKNTKKHFSTLNLSLSTTKYLTNLTSKINQGIKQNQNNNQKVNKLHQFSKSVKKLNLTNNYSRLKQYANFSRTKSITKRSIIKSEIKKNKIIQRFQTESKQINLHYYKKDKSKENLNNTTSIIKSPTALKRFIVYSDKKNKLNSINNSSLSKYITTTIKPYINKSRKIFHSRNHNSMDTNISNMTSENSSILNSNLKSSKYKGSSLDQTSSRKNNSKNKKLGLIGRLKRSIEKFEESKNTSNKKGSLIKDKKKTKSRNKKKNVLKNKSSKNSIENNNNISSYKNNIKNISKKKKIKNINKDNIIKIIEKNWKKEENLINNDPLLITSMNDLEFVPKELKSINISREELSIYINKNKDTSFKSNNGKIDNSKEKNIKEISIKNTFMFENSTFGEFLPNILVFLNKIEILQLKNCSKYFNTFIINYFIKILDKEKINFLEKQNKLNLNEDEKAQKLDIKNLNLNKGSSKAITLLNEEIFNRLFFEEKIPNKDILFAYKVYFQIINFKEITDLYKGNLSDEIFWDNCRNYFQKNNGNITQILKSNIEENKISLTGENLYKIYKLIEKDLYKLNSGYYSKLCGTTGLFMFYIKDILDFIGFSNELKFQKNSYYSFFEIINYIDYKINILSSFSGKSLSF